MDEAKSLADRARALPDYGFNDKQKLWLAALDAFGQGAHTIMDGFSPAHRDFKVYDTRKYGNTYGPLLGTSNGMTLYAADLILHSVEESREPTKEEMNEMVGIMRYRYGAAFGQKELERAISLPKNKWP